jgi:hypothetical protein
MTAGIKARYTVLLVLITMVVVVVVVVVMIYHAISINGEQIAT